jgi:uncharacterized RDD family membrane protein YckC
VSILPLPDLTPGTSPTPSGDVFQPADGIHLSALEAYIGKPGALTGVSFWPRVAARVIDLIAHYIVAICSGFMLGVMFAIIANLQRDPRPLMLMRRPSAQLTLFFFGLLGSVALETVCEGFHGSTLGKMLLDMVVVQEDATPCRPRSAFIRSIGYFVDALFFGLIAYLAMHNNPQHQRHGDTWADTIVCRRSEIEPQNLRGVGHFAMVFLLAAMADSILIITGMLIKVFS